MLKSIITLSLRWPMLVCLAATMLIALSYKAMLETPIDAIPDLSDVQVIVKASYPGQSPDLVEEQVTYPLSTLLMSVPGSETVRGYSFYGDAYLYVIFAEGTDLYWARARVMEYLNQAQRLLPQEVSVELGPDASGVGWIYQYVLTDTSGTHNLADLTRLQDWFIRQELQSVKGVSEVAKVGGMVQTYQIVVDPLLLLQHQLTLGRVESAILAANNNVGGSVVEMAEAEYMVRSQGYLTNLEQFEHIPLGKVSAQGTPVMLGDVSTIRLGPQTRRGVAEWNGKGEVVGGIVVMRDGENARSVITAVKDKIAQIQRALPDGVEIHTAYDRTQLIERAVAYLNDKLVEEILVVIVVCGLFLMHVRATLVVAVCLPCAVLIGFLLMSLFDITANLMSLGGIAIAIGALVDAAIVMVENVQKHQYQDSLNKSTSTHIETVKQACTEVGPALFISLLIITLSFLPIFSLAGQEGRLFTPLAFTKTFVMAAAALLSVTLVPVLILLCLKGKAHYEDDNFIIRGLKALYRPFLSFSLRWPWLIVLVGIAIAGSGYYPWQQLSSEFMPEFDEGDLLYMPTTLPGVSVQEASQLLQQTDRLIKTIPEVDTVFGKVGRADSATDPAPLTMIETTIQLKPKQQWRAGITLSDVIVELESTVQLPGLTNAWVQPIKTRIDMLSTGVKTPVGVKLAGDDLAAVAQASITVEQAIRDITGTASVIAERPLSGRYIDITPDRIAAARYGLSIDDIQQVVRLAIGGQTLTQSIQGKERFPVNLRYPREYRGDLAALKALPFITPSGAWVTLEQVAEVRINQGPALIKSENARTTGWVFINVEPNVALSEYTERLGKKLANISLPPKVTWHIAGEYEYQQRVIAKMTWIIPVTLVIIFALLQIVFRRSWQGILVLATLPIALAGSLWLVYLLNYQLSVAVAVGMIALAGVAAEFGVVMLVYLNTSMNNENMPLYARICDGALQRVRPKAMTVLTIIAGLLPIMFTDGAGSEIMQRIAAPMLGGMLVCPLISMLIIPAVYKLVYRQSTAAIPNTQSG